MHWCGARTEDQCQTLEQTLPQSEACIASCGSAIFEGSAEFPEKSLFALAVSRGPRPYVNGTARCAKKWERTMVFKPVPGLSAQHAAPV